MNSQYDTLRAYSGAVTNPGAGQVLASVTPTVGGYYKIRTVVYTSGTTTAADADNFLLNTGGSNPAGQLMAAQGNAAISALEQTTFATVAAGQAITVTTSGAASGASAVYRATIAAELWPREENTSSRTQ